MKNLIISFTIIIIWLCSLTANSATCEKNYLTANGNKLYDSNGQEVLLRGVNWFGFETAMGYFHGIWSRDHKSMLQQIKDQGFNCIRIPWNNAILTQNISGQLNAYGTDPYTGVSPMNEEEATKTTSLEILDIAIKWCQENNMKVILDNHSREPDGYMVEKLWYTEKVSHEKWIEDWVFLTNRYKDYDAVIAMDINNEPHGDYGSGARWGTGDPANDWRLAAQECGNAILAANPEVLIMVEGTEEFEETSYWWGGNLQGAKQYPVELTHPNKLVYSPHEYGPTVHNQEWFSDPSFPSNMTGIWEENFNYLHTEGTSPLFFGEFGIKDQGGKDEVWFDTFVDFMGTKGHHWTFWCWNPNSGDTGGLLDDQWKTVVEWKMDKLRPHLASEIPNCETSITIPVTGVTLTPASLNLAEGETGNLTATITPSNATNKSVIYSSSNTNVATINASGVVSAIAEGTTTITVTTINETFTDNCTITVTESNSNIPVSGVEVSHESISIQVGATNTLTATVLPTNASNRTVSWSSDNSLIASVDESGLITGISEGSTTVTATTQDGDFSATSLITIHSSNNTCNFNIPLPNALPTINSSYSNIHVSESGPNLNNVAGFTINWDLNNNGLWQFSISTNNGQPDWYVNLLPKLTHNFNSTQPSVSITSSGIAGLDGEYFVAIDNENFVLIEKSNSHIIHFSNSPISPCPDLKKGTFNISGTAQCKVEIYPNPFTEYLNLNLSSAEETTLIQIIDQTGRVIEEQKDLNEQSSIELGHNLPTGIYHLHIKKKESFENHIIIKQ